MSMGRIGGHSIDLLARIADHDDRPRCAFRWRIVSDLPNDKVGICLGIGIVHAMKTRWVG